MIASALAAAAVVPAAASAASPQRDTTGAQVPVTARYSGETTDFASGTISGVQGHVVIPGQGTVVLDAGRMEFGPDGTSFTGRFDLLRDANTAALCDALDS